MVERAGASASIASKILRGEAPAVLADQTTSALVKIEEAVQRAAPRLRWIEAGAFVSGSAALQQIPTWITLEAFGIAETGVTQGQYDPLARLLGLKTSLRPPSKEQADLPIVGVPFDHVNRFTDALGKLAGTRYRLPNPAERERAARGRSIDLREFVKSKDLTPAQFLKRFWGSHFENAVLFDGASLAGGMMTNDPRLISRTLYSDTSLSIAAWRVYGTADGSIEGVWFNQSGPRVTPAGSVVDGVRDLSGNVWEWVTTGHLMGGSFRSTNSNDLRPATQANPHASTTQQGTADAGFRLAL